MPPTTPTPDQSVRIAALEAELIAVRDGYRHQIYELRERITGTLGRDVSRWLTTALDAVRAEPPALVAADEHIERALEAIDAFVAAEQNPLRPPDIIQQQGDVPMPDNTDRDLTYVLRERIAALTDAQIVHALRLDHELWDDAAFAAANVLTTPEANRRLLINRFEQAIAIGDTSEELARIETIFADVTADEPDSGADDACWMIAWRVDGSEYRIMRSDSDAWEQFPIHDDAWAHYGCEAFENPATAGLGLAHIAAGRVNDRWGGNIDWAISRDALSGPPRPTAPGRARIRRRSLPASPEAVAGLVRDPRVQAIADSLTDDQVADVLRQMSEAWTPDEGAEKLLSTPEGNRGLLVEVASMNLGMGGEGELATLAEMADIARRSHPAV